jgi:hypothetical protein
MREQLSVIPFLRMPTVRNQRTDKHAWYAFVMRFDQDQAPKGLTRETFVEALQNRGLKEVDIPRSTGLLNELPLFTHSHEAIPRYGCEPWHPPQQTELFPTALLFFNTVVKLPMWATSTDHPIVQHYANTFITTAEEFLGCKLSKDKNEDFSSPRRDMQTTMMVRAKL